MEVKSIKEQIAPLKWADYLNHFEPLVWFTNSAIGRLYIRTNPHGRFVLLVRSENDNGVLGRFGSLEEAKAEAQERHNNAVMQFFIS